MQLPERGDSIRLFALARMTVVNITFYRRTLLSVTGEFASDI